MDAEVGGEDCTKINSSMKKLENKLIPGRRYQIVSFGQFENFEVTGTCILKVTNDKN